MRTPEMTWPAEAVMGPEAVKLLTRGPAAAVDEVPPDDVPPAVVAVPPVVGVAGAVEFDATVVPSTQQLFSAPTAGSPNTALLHVAPSVSVSVTLCSAVPYLTVRVPLNEHEPPSLAHSVQLAVAASVGVAVGAVALPAAAESLPPPHAESSNAAVETSPIHKLRHSFIILTSFSQRLISRMQTLDRAVLLQSRNDRRRTRLHSP
jgi:hypothetical protein